MAGNDTKSVVIRLEPASLGELRLDVTSSEDGLSVRLISANPAVRQTLEGQASQLHDALVRGGLDVSAVSVTVGAGPGDASPGFTDREAWHAQETPGGPGGNPRHQKASPDQQRPTWGTPHHAGALNVLV